MAVNLSARNRCFDAAFLEMSDSLVLGQSTLSVHSVALKYQSEVTLDSLNNIKFADDEIGLGSDASSRDSISTESAVTERESNVSNGVGSGGGC